MLLVYLKGSYVDRCSTANSDHNVLGTLFVQLPAVFKGGEVSIFNANGDGESSFNLGASGDASFSCFAIAHYKSCEYAFDKMKSGNRILLKYSLLWTVALRRAHSNREHAQQ